MTDFSVWFLIVTIVLLLFTLVMFVLSVIPWCTDEARDTLHHTASWKRMAIPEHDSFSVTLPPLPPYFFESKIISDDYSESM